MPLSYEVLPGNGVDNQFNVSINYLDQSHIAVYIDGVEDTGFTWVNATRLQTSTTPANGANVKISRTTPREKANRLVDWEGNGVITEANLDSSDLQVLYIAQEAFDQLGDVLGVGNDAINWDAESKKILNVANGTDSQDACTYGQLLSATSGGGASITIPNPTGGDTGKLLTAITGGYQLTTSSLGTLSSLDSVSSTELDSDAVTESKIEDDAVTRNKISDGAVNGDKIASDTVTLAKLAHNSTNDELIGYNSGTPSNIVIGSGLSLISGTLENTASTITTYTSSAQTITSAGTLTLAHGLGVEPKGIRLVLECQTSEHGYIAGDKVDISNEGAQLALAASLYYGCGVRFDSTNIKIQYGNNPNVFQLYALSGTPGSPAAATNANWSLIVEAWA